MRNIVNKKVSLLHDDSIESGRVSSETARLRVPGGHVLLNTKDTLSRIKEELGIHTDVDLAETMGVGIRRIHNWKQRNTIPTEAIAAICGSEGLDLEYILTGNKAHANRSVSEDAISSPPAGEKPRVC